MKRTLFGFSGPKRISGAVEQQNKTKKQETKLFDKEKPPDKVSALKKNQISSKKKCMRIKNREIFYQNIFVLILKPGGESHRATVGQTFLGLPSKSA